MATDAPPTAWLRASDSYELALAEGRLACRNARGTVLKSVPKAARETETAAELIALRDWLTRHEAECRATVETWMTASVSVPTALLASVWPDPAWSGPLRNLVVVAEDVAGLTRGVSDGRLGVVDLDGETAWIEADSVRVPHPIDIPDLADFRDLLAELGEAQGVGQLARQVYPRPADVPADRTSLSDWAGAAFKELRHATGRAQSGGFAVRGGFAVCRLIDGERRVQARYWIGSGSPEEETWTGELVWVDEDEKSLPVAGLGPVAYSEGVRMAEFVHAGRVVNEEEGS